MQKPLFGLLGAARTIMNVSMPKRDNALSGENFTRSLRNIRHRGEAANPDRWP